jgi:sugar lactone lactonase YvrE
MSSIQPNRLATALLFLGLVLAGCESTQEPPEAIAPDEIIIEQHNLFPEGIEYDDGGDRFLLGSVTEGTIHAVFDNGTLNPFIEDEELLSTGGIEIDHINNRLLVAISSHSWDQGMLGAYDLETGERIFIADLTNLYPSDSHLVNDVAVDANGIAYVTDTFAPVIYRVDMDGKASIFIVDSALKFINGILVHPDGYLILGAYQNQLFKIPLEDPEVLPIELTDDIEFDITDGIILHPDGSLIMVTFPRSKIYRLSSDDDWNSANLVAVSTEHDAGYGTTVALRGRDVYVIHSHLNIFQENLGDKDSYKIVRVNFEED